MPDAVVLALGGHALAPPARGRPSLSVQRRRAERVLAGLRPLLARGRVVVTHGNGPQVGQALLRSAAARGEAYEVPLDVCVAQTQAEIGYLLVEAIERVLGPRGMRPVVCVLTRVVVDPRDPRLARATKTVGAPAARGRRAARGRGGDAVPRTVPSPVPLRVLETAAVAALLDAGAVVVAGGGGGVPVRADARGRWRGVEAVVDKDWTSALLAVALGIPRIVNLTSVEGVRLDYGTPRERPVASLALAEAKERLARGEFEAGSMAPKVESAVWFLEHGGRRVDVASTGEASLALEGRAGTRLVAAASPPRSGS